MSGLTIQVLFIALSSLLLAPPLRHVIDRAFTNNRIGHNILDQKDRTNSHIVCVPVYDPRRQFFCCQALYKNIVRLFGDGARGFARRISRRNTARDNATVMFDYLGLFFSLLIPSSSLLSFADTSSTSRNRITKSDPTN